MRLKSLKRMLQVLVLVAMAAYGTATTAQAAPSACDDWITWTFHAAVEICHDILGGTLGPTSNCFCHEDSNGSILYAECTYLCLMS